jgi:hypothetical protein
MSVTSGASALKPCSSGGSFSGSEGLAGISMIFLIAHFPDPFAPPSRYQSQIDLPLAPDLEGLGVHQERAARAAAVRAAERGHVDAIRTAMHGVRRCVSSTSGKLLAIDHLHDGRLPGIGLGVQHVDAGRVDAAGDEIPPLHVGMRRVRAQARAAGVPAEVMELVADVRHVGLPDQAAVARRLRVEVEDPHRVGLALAGRVDERDVAKRFRLGLHRHPSGRIERGIWRQERHGAPPISVMARLGSPEYPSRSSPPSTTESGERAHWM